MYDDSAAGDAVGPAMMTRVFVNYDPGTPPGPYISDSLALPVSCHEAMHRPTDAALHSADTVNALNFSI